MQAWMGRCFQWSAAVTDLKCNSCLCQYWFLCKLFAESKPERSGTILGTKDCWQLRPRVQMCATVQWWKPRRPISASLGADVAWCPAVPPTTPTASQPTSCGHGAKKGSFSHPSHKRVAENFGLCSLLTVRSSRLCCSYFWTVARFRAEEWGTVLPCKQNPSSRHVVVCHDLCPLCRLAGCCLPCHGKQLERERDTELPCRWELCWICHLNKV